ncbi:MAG: hypothetical protein ACK4JF_06435 [Methylohalobius sp.]
MSDLPFDLNSKAAARWVTELESVPIKTRARYLYDALKALNARALPEAVRLALLEILRPSVFAASEILAQDSARLASPLLESARNAVKLSALLHHELAAGYERALTEATAVAGHRIMVSLGWMLVRTLQWGGTLRSSAWKRLYAIYQQGEIQGWLTRPENEPLSGDSAEIPQDRFKCAVAFAALTPMWFDPCFMGELFRFLLQRRQHIAMGEAPVAGGWFIDLSQGRGPRCAGPAPETSGRFLYLSMSLSQPEELPLPLAPRLRHLLGQLPEDEYALTRRVDELWRGWESIVAELNRHKAHLIPANGWLAMPEFELAPLGEDLSFPLCPASSRSRVYRQLNALLRLRRDDSIAVLETAHVGIQPGDLIMLKLLDETLLAAVVRWVKASVQETKTRAGLDLFGKGVECVQVLIVGQGPIRSVGIIAAQGGNSVLLLPPLRLKLGSRVMIGGSEAQIARLLEWTDAFCAYCLIHQ